MKLPRPFIPYSVRLIVAERQCREFLDDTMVSVRIAMDADRTMKERLHNLLHLIFGDEPRHLDHQPALVLRDYNPRTERYTPDANNPEYLRYRTVTSHKIKTTVSGDGAQRSDISAMMHQRRMDENRGKRKRRPKVKLKSRGFQKGIKRPFRTPSATERQP